MAMVMNTYDGPYPPGVPNPFTPMRHAYPTRYHGPVYTRPMFGKPWIDRPYDFGVEPGMAGLGAEEPPPGAEPRTHVECDERVPVPEDIESPQDFAAYLQNQACHERVRASTESRRWLLGIGAAFIVGALVGRGL